MKKTIIRLFLVHAFITGIAVSFFFTTYTLFLKGKGITLLEMNIINATFMASVFLLEVPTGAFADFYGRVRSTIAGSLFLAISFAAYYFSNHFWLFISAEIIGACGHSLISGATRSWVVDWLNHFHAENETKKVFQHQMGLSQIGIMIGAFTGSQLGNINLSWPWIASAISYLLVAAYVSFWPENHGQRNKGKVCFAPILKIAKEGCFYSVKRKDILYISLFSALLNFSYQSINMYWAILFSERGISVSKLGWMFVGVSLAIAIGAYLGKLLPLKSEEKRTFLVVPQLITGLAIIGLSLSTSNPFLIAILLMHEMGRGFFKPIKDVQINLAAPERIRATVNSFSSMIEKLGAFAGLLLSGWLAQELSIRSSWMISGIVICVGVILFYEFRKKCH
ncbi:MAG: MFS transporter [Patescibacteria group bacterium]